MTAPDAGRHGPAGRPLLRQSWGDLLFLHWPVDERSLRPRIPAALELDTFDGTCWVGITPFAMWDTAPTGIPSLPLLSRSLELNVRTYVRLGGEPGIWFFSLDVQNPLMLLGARLFFGLPYFGARMKLQEREEKRVFSSRRLYGPEGRFEASWRRGDYLPQPPSGTIEHFLVERYTLFASRFGRLLQARVRHPTWTLRRAALDHLSTNLLEAHRIPAPAEPSLVHAQGDPVHVWIWPPHTVHS